MNRCTCGHKQSRHSKNGPCWHLKSKCRCKNFEKADSNRGDGA